MRIAYNVFYDYTRKRQLAVSDWQLAESQQPTANSQQPLKMDLYAALALLKPDERTCITLQLIDGYDIAGIAKITGLKDKITGLKEGTVKSHLSRGKEKLANYLRQNGYDGR